MDRMSSIMRAVSIISGAPLRNGLLAAAILIGGSAATLRAQEASRTLERTYQFDERGDATIQFSFQLGAKQWAQWKDQYGDHPDMLLRNLKYQLAAAVIDDFSLEKDEIHRTALAKIKARAVATYRNGGQFAIQVPKNMKLVAGSGSEWVFTNSELEQGGIVNITDRAKLPAKAQNAHLATGNDYNQLVYSIDLSPSRPKALLYGGIVLFLTAGVLGLVSLISSEKKTAPPPLPL